jgi:hypothetical protein
MNNQKYDIIKSFVDNNSSNFKQLSIKLNSSLKTAYNLVNKYKQFGKEAFRHKNHDHKTYFILLILKLEVKLLIFIQIWVLILISHTLKIF